jgi:hypothetical protein
MYKIRMHALVAIFPSIRAPNIWRNDWKSRTTLVLSLLENHVISKFLRMYFQDLRARSSALSPLPHTHPSTHGLCGKYGFNIDVWTPLKTCAPQISRKFGQVYFSSLNRPSFAAWLQFFHCKFTYVLCTNLKNWFAKNGFPGFARPPPPTHGKWKKYEFSSFASPTLPPYMENGTLSLMNVWDTPASPTHFWRYNKWNVRADGKYC